MKDVLALLHVSVANFDDLYIPEVHRKETVFSNICLIVYVMSKFVFPINTIHI